MFADTTNKEGEPAAAKGEDQREIAAVRLRRPTGWALKTSSGAEWAMIGGPQVRSTLTLALTTTTGTAPRTVKIWKEQVRHPAHNLLAPSLSRTTDADVLPRKTMTRLGRRFG